jgi:hypothetical protein
MMLSKELLALLDKARQIYNESESEEVRAYLRGHVDGQILAYNTLLGHAFNRALYESYFYGGMPYTVKAEMQERANTGTEIDEIDASLYRDGLTRSTAPEYMVMFLEGKAVN